LSSSSRRCDTARSRVAFKINNCLAVALLSSPLTSINTSPQAGMCDYLLTGMTAGRPNEPATGIVTSSDVSFRSGARDRDRATVGLAALGQAGKSQTVGDVGSANSVVLGEDSSTVLSVSAHFHGGHVVHSWRRG
jgi:hypothetical protein